jgi:hypothetical protein
MIKSRKMRGIQHISHIREMRSWYRVWLASLEGRDHLVESVCRWNYNIKMYPREMGLEGVD